MTQKVYNFIRNFIKTKKYPPSWQEIADEFGFSRQNTARYIKRLISLGYLKNNARFRGLTLTNKEYAHLRDKKHSN